MSKRSPFTYGTENPDQAQPKVWRSLNEFAGTPQFKEALEREFPEGASELNDEFSRRSFLGLMGASIGLAGLTACRRPEEKVLPYSKAPEEVVPGVPQMYATSMLWAGTAVGLLVESHAGRPTKIEGNPLHPDSLGAANAFMQAELLNMFDPERSKTPLFQGQEKTWAEAGAALSAQVAGYRATRGRGLAILTESHRSESLKVALLGLQERLPQSRVYRYDPFSRWSSREGARLAFGKPLERVYRVDQAKVLVALDSDFLHSDGSALKHARGFADNRKLDWGHEGMNRLYSVESSFTVTGANADHRLRLQSQRVTDFVLALVQELASTHSIAVESTVLAEVATAVGSRKSKLAEGPTKFMKVLAKDLAANRGQSLLIVGQRQPAAVHALVFAVNDALGNTGKTVSYVEPFDDTMDGTGQRLSLVDGMKRGDFTTLIILGGNPLFDMAGDLEFKQALSRVENVVHLSTHVDETSAAISSGRGIKGWHLPRAHFLESWSDVRAEDGTISITQPLIAPLYGSKTDAEVVDLLVGRNRKAYEIVRTTFEALTRDPPDFEKKWRKALHDGVWEGSTYPAQPVVVRGAGSDLLIELKRLPQVVEEIEYTFAPDSHAGDGRYANVGWMQEMPDPMTKLTWDNAALVSPTTAKKLNVVDGQYLELKNNGAVVKIPVLVTPGQADDSIALTVGQGRTEGLSKDLGQEKKPWSPELPKTPGFDCYQLRKTSDLDVVTGIGIQALSETYDLARTQEHHVMEGRALVRESSLTKYLGDREFAAKALELPRVKEGKVGHNGGLLSVFFEHKYEGHKWGMVIDLNSCIGCNACMVACQSENNIPLVGKTGVIGGREMHWIRIDRYYTGENMDEPQAVMQPIPCQQCEDAPCETVCPVAATTHSPEGLNDMAYNRCVGTRYCANNCPFKVRRFNFLNYNKKVPEVSRMRMNPDVTVRSRGVMEKCTYCVQRINHAKIISKQPGNEAMIREKKKIHDQNGVEQDAWLLKDKNITTACQQTCPTQAITFGDLNDPEAAVTKLADQPRDYKLLAELNIRPRTSYLAKVRNPNPELA